MPQVLKLCDVLVVEVVSVRRLAGADLKAICGSRLAEHNLRDFKLRGAMEVLQNDSRWLYRCELVSPPLPIPIEESS